MTVYIGVDLAVVHTLEPVTRFDRARRIAAYCGLDPTEHSSGNLRPLHWKNNRFKGEN